MAKKSASEKQDRMIHVRLTEALHKRLRIRVAELDTTIQDWVAATVERELDRQEREEARMGEERLNS